MYEGKDNNKLPGIIKSGQLKNTIDNDCWNYKLGSNIYYGDKPNYEQTIEPQNIIRYCNDISFRKYNLLLQRIFRYVGNFIYDNMIEPGIEALRSLKGYPNE